MLTLLLALPALAEDPDAYDDPDRACTVWRSDAETGKRIGPKVRVRREVARAPFRVLARRVDAETVESRDGALVATWTTDEYGDPFAALVWQPHGVYRSHRFWDDGIFAFELPSGGAQLRYDLMGCDRDELLLAAVGVIQATHRR